MKYSIVVTAYRSGMGKTTFVCRFLQQQPQWAAVKIITYHSHKMPAEINEKGFDIITQMQIISQKGTDTVRMWEIVCDKVFWVRTKANSQRIAFKDLFERLKNFDYVIFEGTSILNYHTPNKSILLVDDGYKKPSVQKVLAKIDIFLPAIHFDFSQNDISLPGEPKKKFMKIKWNNEENFRRLLPMLLNSH